MSLRVPPTGTAFQNWKKLDEHQRHAAVLWVIKYMQRELPKYKKSFGKHVVHIGHGIREAWQNDGTRRTYTGSVVKIFLDRKIKKEFQEKIGDYPTWVQISKPVPIQPKQRASKKDLTWQQEWRRAEGAAKYKPKRRKRLVLAIPVSVTLEPAFRGGQAGAPAPAQKQRLVVQGNAGSLTGTSCVLLRQRGNTPTDLRYILTCHHVARNSFDSVNLKPDPSAECFSAQPTAPPRIDGAPAADHIGDPVAGIAEINASLKTNIDAGVIQLNPMGLALAVESSRKRYWRARPSMSITSEGQWTRLFDGGQPSFKLYPWGNQAPVKLKYFGMHAPFEVPYGETQTSLIWIQQVIQFECTIPPEQDGFRTYGGYSGSPIMYKNMTGGLVAMHIAGNIDGPPWYSLGIPMWLMTEPGTITTTGYTLA